MPIEQIFDVPVKGIGKPDYSREIALGRTRPGLTLKYLQTLRLFAVCYSNIASLFPHIQPPLASGAFGHLIDTETGMALPFTLPAGYIYTLVQLAHSANQDFRLLSYVDTIFSGYFGTSVSGFLESTADVAAFSSVAIDPTGSSAHIFDIQIENLGGGDLYGSFSMYGIQEAVGTQPLPNTKIVRCKGCSHEFEVPRKTTAINCPKCNQLNIYYDLSRIREL